MLNLHNLTAQRQLVHAYMCSLREKESLCHQSDTLKGWMVTGRSALPVAVTHAVLLAVFSFPTLWGGVPGGGGGGRGHKRLVSCSSEHQSLSVKEALIHHRLLISFRLLRPALLALRVELFSCQNRICTWFIAPWCCVCLPLSPMPLNNKARLAQLAGGCCPFFETSFEIEKSMFGSWLREKEEKTKDICHFAFPQPHMPSFFIIPIAYAGLLKDVHGRPWNIRNQQIPEWPITIEAMKNSAILGKLKFSDDGQEDSGGISVGEISGLR